MQLEGSKGDRHPSVGVASVAPVAQEGCKRSRRGKRSRETWCPGQAGVPMPPGVPVHHPRLLGSVEESVSSRGGEDATRSDTKRRSVCCRVSDVSLLGTLSYSSNTPTRTPSGHAAIKLEEVGGKENLSPAQGLLLHTPHSG
ncbi:unnamed protein product, partial [Discosporangium mesarthrocarpum]